MTDTPKPTLAETGGEIERLRQDCELEAENAGLKARLADAEAATQALMKAIKPFADAVFNDNGDMTVGGFDTYESCIAAYWTRKKTRAYLAARPKDKPA